MSLQDLSNELLYEIASHLPIHSLAELSYTNRHLHQIANHGLYTRDSAYALTWAAGKGEGQGEIPTIALCLSYGADINARDEKGQTALLTAADAGDYDPITVLFLVRNGASASQVDKDGRNAVHLMAANGHNQTLEMVVKEGANLDARTQEGETALMLIGEYNDIVDTLLDSGVDIDATDNQGETAFCKAAFFGGLHVVRQFHERGANTNTLNLNGLSPLCHASQSRHADVVAWMLDNGIGGDIEPNPLNGADGAPLLLALRDQFSDNHNSLKIVDFLLVEANTR